MKYVESFILKVFKSEKIHKFLQNFSLTQRITLFNLKPLCQPQRHQFCESTVLFSLSVTDYKHPINFVQIFPPTFTGNSFLNCLDYRHLYSDSTTIRLQMTKYLSLTDQTRVTRNELWHVKRSQQTETNSVIWTTTTSCYSINTRSMRVAN